MNTAKMKGHLFILLMKSALNNIKQSLTLMAVYIQGRNLDTLV